MTQYGITTEGIYIIIMWRSDIWMWEYGVVISGYGSLTSPYDNFLARDDIFEVGIYHYIAMSVI